MLVADRRDAEPGEECQCAIGADAGQDERVASCQSRQGNIPCWWTAGEAGDFKLDEMFEELLTSFQPRAQDTDASHTSLESSARDANAASSEKEDEDAEAINNMAKKMFDMFERLNRIESGSHQRNFDPSSLQLPVHAGHRTSSPSSPSRQRTRTAKESDKSEALERQQEFEVLAPLLCSRLKADVGKSRGRKIESLQVSGAGSERASETLFDSFFRPLTSAGSTCGRRATRSNSEALGVGGSTSARDRRSTVLPRCDVSVVDVQQRSPASSLCPRSQRRTTASSSLASLTLTSDSNLRRALPLVTTRRQDIALKVPPPPPPPALLLRSSYAPPAFLLLCSCMLVLTLVTGKSVVPWIPETLPQESTSQKHRAQIQQPDRRERWLDFSSNRSLVRRVQLEDFSGLTLSRSYS